MCRYNFLAVDCHAYLAPFENHTIYFLKAIVQGTKKYISCDRVRYLSVPHYFGLGVKEILAELQRHAVAADYLPEEDDLHRLPRQWLINVAYTLVEQEFADWVKTRTEARNQKLLQDQKMCIDIDPDILRAFNASTNVSSKYHAAPRHHSRRAPHLVVLCSPQRKRRLPAQGWEQAPAQAG